MVEYFDIVKEAAIDRLNSMKVVFLLCQAQKRLVLQAQLIVADKLLVLRKVIREEREGFKQFFISFKVIRILFTIKVFITKIVVLYTVGVIIIATLSFIESIYLVIIVVIGFIFVKCFAEMF